MVCKIAALEGYAILYFVGKLWSLSQAVKEIIALLEYMLPQKTIMQDTVDFVYFQMATTTAKSTQCRDGVIFVCSILRGMSTVIDCIVFIIAGCSHLESISKRIFIIWISFSVFWTSEIFIKLWSFCCWYLQWVKKGYTLLWGPVKKYYEGVVILNYIMIPLKCFHTFE